MQPRLGDNPPVVSPHLRQQLPWRQLVAGAGVGALALGLADRMAFLVTPAGVVLVLAGTGLLACSLLLPLPHQGSLLVMNLAFAGLFTLLAALSAFAPYQVSPVASGITLVALACFFAFEPPQVRRFRIWVVAGLLLAAHATLIWQLPFPKQDAFRILTYGVDHLFRAGLNPYQPFRDPVSPDVVRRYVAGYPPGALVVLAPFRLLLGDVRWGFIAGEAAFVAAVAAMAGVRRGLPTWREAAILLPLVLPRTSQAFYDFGNHDWVLLGLAAAAVALRRRWALCGVLLGLGIATKQYFVVFPALYLLPWLDRRALALAAVTAAALFLPFVAWDSRQLVISLMDTFTVAPDPDRLTLTAMLRLTGIGLGSPGTVVLMAVGGATATALAWLGRRRLDRALVAAGLGLVVVTLCFKFAGYNYYAYAIALAAWGTALSDVDEGEQAGRHPGVLGVSG